MGDAVEYGDCPDDGELLEFCPHGDDANLGVVVFWLPLATEAPAAAVEGRLGVVEVTVGGAEVGWWGRGKGEEGEGLMGGREFGFVE